MKRLTHLSLFSGIGGIDLAAEQAGFETIGQVEIEDYPFAILNKHWPEVPKWRDIYEISGKDIVSRIGQPTLISAGFPCQPHSCAGKRQASCDERDPWPELRRVICEIKPRWFLGENVAGLRSSETGWFFNGILRDLATMGYVVGWGSWKAAHIGAPHHRERIFIVAHLNGGSSSDGVHGKRVLWNPALSQIKPGDQHAPNATCKRVGSISARSRDKGEGAPDTNGSDPFTPDLHIAGLQGHWQDGKRPCELITWQGTWKESWPKVATRLCRVDDGVPGELDGLERHVYCRLSGRKRKKRLKCLGNAVVPQQVYPILKAIADYETGCDI